MNIFSGFYYLTDSRHCLCWTGVSFLQVRVKLCSVSDGVIELSCGCEVVEKLGGGKRVRPSVTPAVEKAQAIARSRLHSYASTPLLRLQPSATSTSYQYQGTGSTSDDDPWTGTVDPVLPCYEKKLLIPPSRRDDRKQANPTSDNNIYLIDCKCV